MKFSGYVRESLANLLSAKLRSFLAILGILVGTGSGATGYISTIFNDLTDSQGIAWADDEMAQNVDFETIADGFLDFSEVNPFGDPSETY